MADKYANGQVIQGLWDDTVIVPSERNATGNITWDIDDAAEFTIKQEQVLPRFQTCLAHARALKKQYPLEGLDPIRDRDEIIRREQAIVISLFNIINKPEHYGPHNLAIASSAQSIVDNALHNDFNRRNSNNPADMSEFKAGESVCRHRAPLMSLLCHEAGLPNLMIYGGQNSSFKIDASGKAKPRNIDQVFSPHAYDVSRLTGNVIEACADGPASTYLIKSNAITVDDIVAGESIIIRRGDNIYITYGTYGRRAHAIENEMIAERKALLQNGNMNLGFLKMPKTINSAAYSNQLEITVAAYDQQLVTQLHQKIQSTQYLEQALRAATGVLGETAIRLEPAEFIGAPPLTAGISRVTSLAP